MKHVKRKLNYKTLLYIYIPIYNAICIYTAYIQSVTQLLGTTPEEIAERNLKFTPSYSLI